MYCRSARHQKLTKYDFCTSIILDYGDMQRCTLILQATRTRSARASRCRGIKVEAPRQQRYEDGREPRYPHGKADELTIAHAPAATGSQYRCKDRGSLEAFEGSDVERAAHVAGGDDTLRVERGGRVRDDGGRLRPAADRARMALRRSRRTADGPRIDAHQHFWRYAASNARLDRRLGTRRSPKKS